MQGKSLSERQKEILEEIIKFKKEYGFSTTVRELCKLVGLKPTSSMVAQLSNLKDSGHITWIESMPRTITVMEKGVAEA
ncbi:MAG: LexA repressor [Lachnospiraceae bacterium]|nr:LexA repressor [Lachnospiraceae bacterium]